MKLERIIVRSIPIILINAAFSSSLLSSLIGRHSGFLSGLQRTFLRGNRVLFLVETLLGSKNERARF